MSSTATEAALGLASCSLSSLITCLGPLVLHGCVLQDTIPAALQPCGFVLLRTKASYPH